MGLTSQATNQNDRQTFTVSSVERHVNFTVDLVPYYIKMDIGVFKGQSTFFNVMKRPIVRLFVNKSFADIDLKMMHRIVLNVASAVDHVTPEDIYDELIAWGLDVDESVIPSIYHGNKPINLLIVVGVRKNGKKDYARLLDAINERSAS